MGLFNKKNKGSSQPSSQQSNLSGSDGDMLNQNSQASKGLFEGSENETVQKKGIGLGKKIKKPSKQGKPKAGLFGFGSKKKKKATLIEEVERAHVDNATDSEFNDLMNKGFSNQNNDVSFENTNSVGREQPANNQLGQTMAASQTIKNDVVDMSQNEGESGVKSKKSFGFGKNKNKNPTDKASKVKKKSKQKPVTKNQKTEKSKSLKVVALVLGALIILSAVSLIVLQFAPTLMGGSKISGNVEENTPVAEVSVADTQEQKTVPEAPVTAPVDEPVPETSENNTQPDVKEETPEAKKEAPTVTAEVPEAKKEEAEDQEGNTKPDSKNSEETAALESVKLGAGNDAVKSKKMSYDDFLKETEKTIYREEE